MVWTAEDADPRLVESRKFGGEAALKVWLTEVARRYGRDRIRVNWTDDLRSDERLMALLKQTIGAASLNDTATITWSPEPPPNKARWEAEIRSVLREFSGHASVHMVAKGNRWRVETAIVRTGGRAVEVRAAVVEHLAATVLPFHP